MEALASVTPAQLAEEIRSAARDVYRCGQAWRRSADWSGDKLARKGYELIAVAVATLDALPEPATCAPLMRASSSARAFEGSTSPQPN